VNEPTSGNNIVNSLDLLQNNFKQFNVIYTNADCFTNKKDDLKLFLDTLNFKPDLIVITEVNSKNPQHGIYESEFTLDGFNLVGANIGKDKCRGIIIYVNNDWKYSEIDVSSQFSEFLVVQIMCGSKSIITVAVIYRSPSSNAGNDSFLCDLLSELNVRFSGQFLCVGDFNYGNINWSDWTIAGGSNSPAGRFISCLRKNLLQQHVLFPTRARGSQTPKTLDLVIGNDDIVSDVISLSPLGKSDHSVLHCVCNVTETDLKITNKLNYSKGDYDGLRTFVCDKLYDCSVFDVNDDNNNDIESMWSHFKTTLKMAVDKFIPVSQPNIWRKKKTWFHPINKGTSKLIKRKHRLWTRFQETRDNKVLAEFKQCRNLVRKETRKISMRFQQDIAKACKRNPKKFWKHVNSKSKSFGSIGNITVNDISGCKQILTADLDKANAFAEYFEKVCTAHNDQTFSVNQLMPVNYMPDMIFSEESIKQKLNKLNVNSSPGPDVIHPRVLSELQDIIPTYLATFFNLSLEQGKIPEDWKCSFITAIHKKGKKDCINNYRPISLTSVVCKIMESVVKDNIMQYFFKYNIFSDRQYGFITGRSVSTQLLKVVDDWTSYIDEGCQVDVVYTDFEKAFDKIPHAALLGKIRMYGLNDQLITWISDFLHDRLFTVRINGSCSSERNVMSGVPQGSVLGPLLFVIFINDLPEVCSNLSHLFLFADDAKIYKVISCKDDCELLNNSCQLVYEWSTQWGMNINVDKCKVLSVAKNKLIEQSFNYGFSSNGIVLSLERVDNMRDLGVVMDTELSFKSHIHDKINKAFMMLGIINRNFKDLDMFSLILLYKSMVRSHLEFASSVWSPYRTGLICDIERVQKRATKMIKACKGLPYKERLKFLNLPTLKFRRVRGDMIEVYKILSGVYNSNIAPNLVRSTDIRTRGNSLKLSHTRSHYDLRKHSFCSRVVGVWNSLPDNVVNVLSVNSFKNALDKLWVKEEMYFDIDASLPGMLLA